jgi:hypothetical protein
MPNMQQNYAKTPQAVLDYSIDWSAWLDSDTLSGSSWFASPPGIVIKATTKDNSRTTVWLAGGVSGVTYTITNQIRTLAGRTEERSLTILVMDR